MTVKERTTLIASLDQQIADLIEERNSLARVSHRIVTEPTKRRNVTTVRYNNKVKYRGERTDQILSSDLPAKQLARTLGTHVNYVNRVRKAHGVEIDE
jgi:hypothetical protein